MPDVTYSYTAAQAGRMLAAVGREMNLGRDATAAEAKSFWLLQQKVFVQQSERKAAVAAAVAPIQDAEFAPS